MSIKKDKSGLTKKERIRLLEEEANLYGREEDSLSMNNFNVDVDEINLEEEEEDSEDEFNDGHVDDDFDDDLEDDEFDDSDDEDDDESTKVMNDTMQSLIVAVKELTDKIAQQNAKTEESSPEPDETSVEETSEDDLDDLDLGDETSEESSEESSEDDDFEGDDSEDETSEDDDFEGDEESSEEESDVKAESLIKKYSKSGGILHEKSNYLIGKMYSGRFDLLEEPILAIVKNKIRMRIEESKQEFRKKSLNKKYN